MATPVPGRRILTFDDERWQFIALFRAPAGHPKNIAGTLSSHVE